jgi:hypothetical protein
MFKETIEVLPRFEKAKVIHRFNKDFVKLYLRGIWLIYSKIDEKFVIKKFGSAVRTSIYLKR